MYKLKGQPEQALVHDSIEPNELWHRIFQHVHYRVLPLASKIVEALPEIHAKHEGVCKGCAKGKNTKKKFPSSKRKEKGILEIIHSDVCSPMSSSSLSGYVYYVSFIDHIYRKTWIENYTKKNIKIFRSDNGEEFTSNEFKELCIDSGIKRDLNTPYNPQ